MRRIHVFLAMVVLLAISVCTQAQDPDLLGWWKFDEGAGTMAFDSSGNGHDGTFAGDPDWVAGRFGSVWSFTTGDFLVVDDFESYTDDDAAGEAIWQTWVDGFGVADNGSQVGYLLPPYAEQTIVHGGRQSMPLLYSNPSSLSNSEVALTLTAPRDWTEDGVAVLSLWFRGISANPAEPLYVSIANATGVPAITAHSDLNAAQTGAWTEWRIALEDFASRGINLTNVDKIAIGLGSKSGTAGPGGAGTIYIDDIRLYRP